MKASITTSSGKTFSVDLSKPIDLSLPLSESNDVSAFFIPGLQRNAFEAGGFVGDVTRGGSCNVFTLTFNPHGNGTHTETVGHITPEAYPLNDYLKQFFFEADLITVSPIKSGNDYIITSEIIQKQFPFQPSEALIIRTLPNNGKTKINYSGSNPPYLDPEAAAFITSKKIKHLILDIPSIDKEDDGGKLSAHRKFWYENGEIRPDCTITEMAFIPDEVKDGHYLLNLMIASFVNDASPSKPVIYKAV